MNFFEAYCQHFKLSTWQTDPQGAYHGHFHNYTTDRGMSGYELIANLHYSSPESAFVEARAAIFLKIYKTVIPYRQSLVEEIAIKEALLCLTYAIPPNFHSEVVFHDGTKSVAS